MIDDEPGLSIFGIVSSEPIYKIALSLNDRLGISLKYIPPIETESPPGMQLSFPRLADLTMLPGKWITIVSNRDEKNLLFKKLRNIDFIMALYSSPEEEENYASGLMPVIKNLKTISAVIEIRPAQADRHESELIIPFH